MANTTTTTMNQNFLCPITQSPMTDPVIGSDGITYERAAIEAWFAAGHATSPLTRAPMTSQSLVPNYALKALIEEAVAGGTGLPAITPTPLLERVPPPPIAIHTERIADTDTYAIRLSAATAIAESTLPTLFIDVLDISGSMGGASVDTSTQATSDAAVFSRADLVRHSVATQIELLRPQDELAIVVFDSAAEIILEPTSMTAMGKTAARACLPQIEPRGGTNIWSGLQVALQIAAAAIAADPHKNIAILLQTDGESDPSLNPPRGIVATFRSWLDAHPAVRPSVHTVGYGFGSALDMPLLRQIADAAGAGSTSNYIPDGSMVGTVFIHLMANLMSCLYRDLRMTVSSDDETMFIPVGFLQGGQTRDFIIHTTARDFTVTVTNSAGTKYESRVDAATCPTSAIGFPSVRAHFIAALHGLLVDAEAGKTVDTAPLVAYLDAHAAIPEAVALRTDVEDADPYKGQIQKGFVPHAFRRWGRHYIPGVLCGHRNQWAINFRDEGSKIYGLSHSYTRSLIARGDDIFTRLPAPRASLACGSTAFAAASISMSSIHSSSGACFLGDSTVMMEDGGWKRCDAVQPGDILFFGAKVRCVLKTHVAEVDVVRLGDGAFTLWHPVMDHGIWRFPADIATSTHVTDTAVYNFVMEGSHLINVGGIITCTMNHGITGPVIGHAYYGGDHTAGVEAGIMTDLRTSPGWDRGYVTWRNVRVRRDSVTGHVVEVLFDADAV
jgi:Mg-chelatase subunit ChlD